MTAMPGLQLFAGRTNGRGTQVGNATYAPGDFLLAQSRIGEDAIELRGAVKFGSARAVNATLATFPVDLPLNTFVAQAFGNTGPVLIHTAFTNPIVLISLQASTAPT